MRPILRCFVTPTHLLSCFEGWASTLPDFKHDNYSKSENELVLMVFFINSLNKITCTLGLMYSNPKAHWIKTLPSKLPPNRPKSQQNLNDLRLALFWIHTKGQVISKGFFGVFNFFQKTNKNTPHSSKNEFICSFFGRIHVLTICFRNYLTFIWL